MDVYICEDKKLRGEKREGEGRGRGERERERKCVKYMRDEFPYVGVGVGVTTWGVRGVGTFGVDGVRPMGRRGLGRRFWLPPAPPNPMFPGLAAKTDNKKQQKMSIINTWNFLALYLEEK